MKNLIYFITIIVTLLSSAIANESYFYRVRAGDQLGEIMLSLGFDDLWGKEGVVQKVADETQEVVPSQGAPIKKAGDLIEPGTWIEFRGELPLACNTRVIGKEIDIVQRLKTKDQMYAFECPDGSRVGEREVANISVNVFEGKKTLLITPYVKFFKNDVTQTSDGSTGEIVSDSSVGAKVEYSMALSEKNQLNFFIDAHNTKIQKPDRRSFVGSDSKAIVRAGFGFARKLNESFKVHSNVSVGNELFLFFPDTQSIQLDTLVTVDLTAGFDAIFYKGGSNQYGTRVNASFIPGRSTDDYKLESNYGVSGSLYMERILKNQKTFVGEVLVKKHTKNTDQFEQDLVDVQLNFGLSWQFE